MGFGCIRCSNHPQSGSWLARPQKGGALGFCAGVGMFAVPYGLFDWYHSGGVRSPSTPWGPIRKKTRPASVRSWSSVWVWFSTSISEEMTVLRTLTVTPAGSAGITDSITVRRCGSIS